jgi:hypothetical protein
MNKSLILAASVLSVLGATALPASAVVTQIGSVNIPADKFTDVRWAHFDGELDRVALSPATDTVDCHHINVVYKNGTVHEVFNGVMEKGSVETIKITGSNANVAALEFSCKAHSLDGARIDLASLSEGDEMTPPGDWSRPASVTTHSGP